MSHRMRGPNTRHQEGGQNPNSETLISGSGHTEVVTEFWQRQRNDSEGCELD